MNESDLSPGLPPLQLAVDGHDLLPVERTTFDVISNEVSLGDGSLYKKLF